jgi:hypothetical protein
LEPGESWCPKFTTEDLPPATTTTTTAGSGVPPTDFQAVEQDISVIDAYAAGHADEVGTPWLDNHTTPPRIVIGFTAHLAEHRAALNTQVNDPTRLLVCQSRHSTAELNAVAAELQARIQGSDAVRTSSVGPDIVHIELRADQHVLANDLLTRYGGLVEIRLGQLPYPDPASAGRSASCPTIPDGPTDYHGLRATLSQPAPVPAGADSGGTVTITNTGTTPQQLTTGSPLVAAVTRPGSLDVIGIYDAPIAGVGILRTVQPGESVTIPYLIGTASCDPTLGYSLPPGTYDVRVQILTDYQGATTVTLLMASPQQLEIVE